MADNKDKTRPKEVLDVDAPITAEELREHEVVEHLLKTHPELQEKSEVGNAVNNGVSKFRFDKWDWIGAIGFGVAFGVIFGSIGHYAIEPLLTSTGVPFLASIGEHIGALCGAGGGALAIKSAIAHPVAEITKNFYDKCKEGYAEAKEHNEAVQFLKQRVSAIKMYKQKHFMKHIMDNPDGYVPSFQPDEKTAAVEYENPRARVVDAILSEKRKAVPEMTWAQRSEAQAAKPQQPTL